MTSIIPIPKPAAAAWQAYNAMEATKHRYFSLLNGLESHYGSGSLAPSQAQQILTILLSDHDAAVRAFKHTVTALKERDPQAHRALVSRMVAINNALTPYLQRRDK